MAVYVCRKNPFTRDDQECSFQNGSYLLAQCLPTGFMCAVKPWVPFQFRQVRYLIMLATYSTCVHGRTADVERSTRELIHDSQDRLDDVPTFNPDLQRTATIAVLV